MSRSRIYLDHAAATPLEPRVLVAMQPYLSDDFYNPSATYQAAREVRRALEDARAAVAHWLGSRSSEIIFTAGGTEANNLALYGVARSYPGSQIVSTLIEHESILRPLDDLASHGWQQLLVAPATSGLVDPKDVIKQVSDKTVLVSIGYANNEIGVIQPIKQISGALDTLRADRRRRGIKRPLYLHTDACQAPNYLDLHVARLGVDLMTINGGKIYGPKQSGVLYCKAGLSLAPLIRGGGQEHNLRSGTENVPAAIGLSKALELVQTDRHEEGKRLLLLQQHFLKLIKQQLPAAIVNGSLKHRLPNNIHLTFPGRDNERLLIQLDEAGVQAAAGSACSASDEEPSHVLKAIGLKEAEAQASLRFTMGRQTTAKAVATTVDTLVRLLANAV